PPRPSSPASRLRLLRRLRLLVLGVLRSNVRCHARTREAALAVGAESGRSAVPDSSRRAALRHERLLLASDLLGKLVDAREAEGREPRRLVAFAPRLLNVALYRPMLRVAVGAVEPRMIAPTRRFPVLRNGEREPARRTGAHDGREADADVNGSHRSSPCCRST